jgi:hypothetical protein
MKPPAILSVLGAITLVAVWSWALWRRSDQLLRESAEQARAVGREEGRDVDERRCLEAALGRYRELSGRAVQEAMLSNLRFRGCLETSRAVPSFCDGVPAFEDSRESAEWQIARSLEAGVRNRYVFEPLQRYCHSGERTRKERAQEGNRVIR